MKIRILFLFIIFNIIFGFSQNKKYVNCIYKVYTPLDYQNLKENKINDKVLKTKPLSYVLIINNNTSQFCILNELPSGDVDASSLRLRKILSFMGNNIETSLSDNEIFEITESTGQKFGIKTKISDYKWNITTETKIIDNYNCFKAVCQIKGLGREGVVIDKDVIAYFCPQLNYQFGPREFCGLPGLILEITVDNTIIGLDSIKFEDVGLKRCCEKENRKNLKIFNNYIDYSNHVYSKLN